MMKKYTIFSTSNRTDNKTQIFAEAISNILAELQIESNLFKLEQLPDQLSSAAMYDYDNSPVAEIVEKYLTSVDNVIFIIPEYNGSFPGILKLFIDAVHPRHFKGKKAALIGVAAGRSGNIRGMDHLTAILQYLKTEVYHNQLPISTIDRVIKDGKISDDATLQLMRDQMQGFTEF